MKLIDYIEQHARLSLNYHEIKVTKGQFDQPILEKAA